jgi:hypothetical protein
MQVFYAQKFELIWISTNLSFKVTGLIFIPASNKWELCLSSCLELLAVIRVWILAVLITVMVSHCLQFPNDIRCRVFFICSFAVCLSYLAFGQIYCSVFSWVFLLLSFQNSSRVLDNNPLWDVSFANISSQSVACLLIFFFFSATGAWTQGLHLEPLHQPFFVKGFFKIGSCGLFAEAGFKPILLISAFWVARIIGVSHQYPALIF